MQPHLLVERDNIRHKLDLGPLEDIANLKIQYVPRDTHLQIEENYCQAYISPSVVVSMRCPILQESVRFQLKRQLVAETDKT